MRTIRAVVYATAALASLASQAHAASPTPELIDHYYGESPDEVIRFWTPERLATVPDKGESLPKPPSEDPLNSDGDPWEGTGPFPAGVGRLYKNHNGVVGSCTATVVDARHPDIVVTAAHCVRGLDGINASHILFAPAYRDGQTPLGRFAAKRVVVPGLFNLFEHDMAFLQLHPDSDGRNVADVAGTQRIGFSRPPSASPAVLFGYPVSSSGNGFIPYPGKDGFSNPEYNGKRLAYCSTQQSRLDPCLDYDQQPMGWGMICVQGAGSSGGPLLVDFDYDTGLGTINGVMSVGSGLNGRPLGCAAAPDSTAQKAFELIQQR